MSENKKKSNAVVNYFKDVKGEMKKVAWPTFKQIKNNTFIVIVSLIVVGLLVALLDFAFGKGFEFIVNKDATPAQEQTIDVENNNVVLDDEADVDAEAETEEPSGTEDAE